MRLLFLTVGATHSGKTTFGQSLHSRLGESSAFIHVDNDIVDEFVKMNFANLRNDPAILATRTPTNPDLRLLIPQLITDYALKENYSVIATAAHPRLVIRQSYYTLAAKHHARVVLLIFRVDHTEALQRIRAANRDTHILDTSYAGGETFEELFERQKKILEEPTIAEKQQCFKVYEVNEATRDAVLEECAAIVQDNNISL